MQFYTGCSFCKKGTAFLRWAQEAEKLCSNAAQEHQERLQVQISKIKQMQKQCEMWKSVEATKQELNSKHMKKMADLVKREQLLNSAAMEMEMAVNNKHAEEMAQLAENHRTMEQLLAEQHQEKMEMLVEKEKELNDLHRDRMIQMANKEQDLNDLSHVRAMEQSKKEQELNDVLHERMMELSKKEKELNEKHAALNESVAEDQQALAEMLLDPVLQEPVVTNFCFVAVFCVLYSSLDGPRRRTAA